MKVIDLLNKIANGEEVPKKIRYEDIIFTYNEYDKDYFEIPISEDEYRGLFNMKDSILTQYLNDEVEIIEDTPKEAKKIPKKLDICSEAPMSYLGKKINEIIDYLESKGE